jgi:hypothetical protein
LKQLESTCGKVQLFVEFNRLLPKEKRWKLPSSAPTHAFCEFSEEALYDLLFSSFFAKAESFKLKSVKSAFDITSRDEARTQYGRVKNQLLKQVRRAYELKTVDEAGSFLQTLHMERKGHIIRLLFGSKFKQKVRALDQEDSDARYIFSQTIKTNGKELQLHAIDTKSKKKQPVTSSTSNTSIVDSAKLATKNKPFKFDKMEQLDYDDDIWYVGIDLGQRYLAGVCAVKGSGEARVVRNLAIKAKAVREPMKLYSNWLHSAKESYDENDEDKISAWERELERKSSQRWNEYFQTYVTTFMKLSLFYNSNSMKRRKWDVKKALRGEYDRAVNAILRMVDTDISKKCEENKMKIIFGIGNSDFSYGKQEDHKSFKTYLYAKLKSLGYRVNGIGEYKTSQMCPRADCHNKCEFISMRVKYCRQCHVFYHRDVMAGENIALALIAKCHDGSRPEYLCSSTTAAATAN